MKVYLYCRTSTEKQQGGLESQRRALEECCKNKGIEEYEIYEDFGFSGAKTSRPRLDELMREVRSGEASTVIVYSLSRFARSTRFLLESLDEFVKLKVNFISLSENIDLSTAMGRAMVVIISAIASLERELVSERVKNGLVNARLKGKQMGRPIKIDYELIIKLRKEGYNYRKIHKLTGVSQGSISNIIKKSVQ